MTESPDKGSISVLWALPAAPDRTKLQALVAELARLCDAPLFEPHLTLGLGGAEALVDIHQEQLRLRVACLDFSEQFTKTLFLRLEMSPELIALRAVLGLAAADDYDPHLSLLYREMPISRKAELARRELLMESVVFDRLAVVRCPDPTSSQADVESWEIVATRPLDPPPVKDGNGS